jgi:hypothetical protein
MAGARTVIGWTMLAGAGVAVATLARKSSVAHSAHSGRKALTAYLHDHIGGAEIAVQVVDRLRRLSANADDRLFFNRLHRELERDREVVVSLLEMLGESPRSAKRLVGHASGSVLKFLAGGARGDLALFRTLEALAIGVQGKRCMWRLLQTLSPSTVVPEATDFAALESAALQQWEAIEARRRALAPQTFAVARHR